MKEHKYAFKTCNMNNAIFYHATEKDHEILWEEIKLLFKCSNCQKRHMVESVLIDKIENFFIYFLHLSFFLEACTCSACS